MVVATEPPAMITPCAFGVSIGVLWRGFVENERKGYIFDAKGILSIAICRFRVDAKGIQIGIDRRKRYTM